MRKPRALAKSELYHVVQGGVGGLILCVDYNDYGRLAKYIQQSVAKYGKIHAYCLMSNHFHLLIETKHLSLCMHQINSSYAHYFNLKYERTGHVFQGRFFSEPIEKESYFKNCVRYILLNPYKGGLVKTKGDFYAWSSFSDYFFDRTSHRTIKTETDFVQNLFSTKLEFYTFIKEPDKPVEFLDPGNVKYFSDTTLIKEIRKITKCRNFLGMEFLEKLNLIPKLLISKPYSFKQLSRILAIPYGFLLKVKKELSNKKEVEEMKQNMQQGDSG
ncbi:MAG: transposase [Bacteroidales bacterium]